MRVTLSGSGGLVGSCLLRHFVSKGDDVYSIVRNPLDVSDDRQILIDLKNETIEEDRLEGMDILIHLSGANIASKRWSKKYETEILDSRIGSTTIISEALCRLKNPPKLFLCASAVGYYGNQRPGQLMDESSLKGDGFLSDVCDQWEKASQRAKNKAVRTVNLRFGAVLSRKGGALKKMLMPFSLGLGGPIGNGNQAFSWVALDEIPLIIDFIIENELISGPVNIVSPNGLSNGEFTALLAKQLNRPAILPLPAFMVELLFGEMGKTILLGGANVAPKKLLDAGYKFKYSSMADALKAVLGKSK